VAELAALVASWLPFRAASELLQRLGLPLSPMTVHRLVQHFGATIAQRQQAEAEAVFGWGELPPSEERSVERLYLEADGVWIHLQREDHRRAEVWTAMTYEGWQATVPRRPRSAHPRIDYRLTGKQVFSEMGGDAHGFWERHATALHHRYDLRAVKQWVLSGDGAPWIDVALGEGSTWLRQLDRFHLARALRRGLGALAKDAYQLCVTGRWPELGQRWAEALQQARTAEQRQRIAQQRAYLERQRPGLEDYRRRLPDAGPECRSLGAMESNGDKLIKNRLAKRGMAWTISGALHMVKVLQEHKNGCLERWLGLPPPADRTRLPAAAKPASAATILEQLGQLSRPEQGAWLQASLPRLQGPLQHRPVYRVLKELARGG
jgi:hypothetical protein